MGGSSPCVMCRNVCKMIIYIPKEFIPCFSKRREVIKEAAAFGVSVAGHLFRFSSLSLW